MLKRDTLVLIIAGACGFFAFVLIFNYLKTASQPKTSVVIANRPIESGYVLMTEDLSYSRPVKNIDSENFFLQVSDAVGRETLEPIERGKAVRRSKVKNIELAQPQYRERSIAIPAGKTGLTLTKDHVANLSDSVHVGNYIDLISAGSKKDNQDPSTIVSGSQIVSIERGDGDSIETFTLSVFPEAVNEIMEASAYGKFTAVIRIRAPQREVAIRDMEIIRGVRKSKKITFTAQ